MVLLDPASTFALPALAFLAQPKSVQVVARRAKHMLTHTWNPCSARSSKRAAAVLGDLMAYLPPDSPVLQVCFSYLFWCSWCKRPWHIAALGACRI